MTRARERKLRMLMMIGFAVLSTSSLAVASFAWFTSSQKATASFTQLRVDAGLQYEFYAYNDNGYDALPSFDEEDTFEDHFTIVDSETLQNNNVVGWWPGQKATFAIKVLSFGGTNISLYLDEYSVSLGSPTRQTVSGGADFNGGIEVRMEWAIDIFAGQSATSDGFKSFMANDTPSDLLDIDVGTSIAHSKTTGAILDPLCDFSELSTPGDLYMFYTVSFSNDSSTWFVETDSAKNPIAAPEPGASVRYFNHDTATGNSSCYSGLEFHINTLRVAT